MAYLRTKRTKSGVVYIIGDRVGTRQINKKVPARSLKEARQYLQAYEMEKCTVQVPSLMIRNITFAELAEAYRAYVKVRVRERTYRYDGYVTNMLLKDFGHSLLKDLTETVIASAQDRWKASGLSNKTINNRSILLGTMFRFAKEKHWLLAMPVIKKLKVDKILEAAEPMVADYTGVFLNTGLRLTELRYLSWDAVDFANRNLHVEKSKSYRPRTIPMNEETEAILRRRQREQFKDSIYVFEFSPGHAVSDYYHRFKRLLDRLGIEGNIHKLRHTFASNLVRQGIPLYEVQHLLGHASYQTTQRYAHLGMVNLRKAVNVLVRCTGAVQNDFRTQGVA